MTRVLHVARVYVYQSLITIKILNTRGLGDQVTLPNSARIFKSCKALSVSQLLALLKEFVCISNYNLSRSETLQRGSSSHAASSTRVNESRWQAARESLSRALYFLAFVPHRTFSKPFWRKDYK